MNTMLAHRFEKLESQRSDVLNFIHPYSWEQLTVAPPGRWSAIQILAHLVTAEKLSIDYMKKKALGIEQTRDTGLLDEVRMLGLRLSQRLALRFKAPAAVVEQTPAYSSLDALIADWNAVREDLKNLLEIIPPHLQKRKIYKHAIAGRVNVNHALIFFREHIIHHQPQLKRLLVAP